jgi:NTP pyrophosphatase (non-canonical NTP hydrolase)
MNDLNDIKEKLRKFALARDWEKFHSPKNLSMALSVEVAELVEVFQWLSEEQSKNLTEEQYKSTQEEVADVFLYLLRLADILDIDLLDSASRKITINANKYPVDKVKGSSKKYTEYK